MKISQFNASCSKEVIELFTQVFSASENKEEGRIIGDLVFNIIETTKPQDLIGFVANSGNKIVGCILFTRLMVPNNKVAFILSPVAVATSKQGTGIGQGLINHGLGYLKSINIDWVFTYGDPHYYSKVGFSPIGENIVSAPFKLSQPEGWLAQALDGSTINAVKGYSKCVEAFNHQAYW